MVVGGDGGPEEAVKNDKVQRGLLWLLKKHQFDVVWGRNSAPRRSAGNRVERRMVALSKAMAGKKLPVFKHGKHLKNGVVIHENLCLMNFNYAGKLLQNILDNLTIDSYTHYAQYLEPMTEEETKERDTEFMDVNLEKFKSPSHYNASTYFLQLKQCLNPNECDYCTKTQYSSPIQKINPHVFLPPPLVFVNNGPNIQFAEPGDLKKGYHFGELTLILSLNLFIPKEITMDYFNEQFVDKKKLLDRICPFCGLHCSSKASVLRHRKEKHYRQRSANDPFDDIELEIEKLQQLKIQNIAKVIHFDGDQYLVQFKDETLEYMHLPANNNFVMEYIQGLQQHKAEVLEVGTMDKLIEYYNNQGIIRLSDDDDIDLGMDSFHIDKINDNDDNKNKKNNIQQKKPRRKRTRKEIVAADSSDSDDVEYVNKRFKADMDTYSSSSDWDDAESTSSDDEPILNAYSDKRKSNNNNKNKNKNKNVKNRNKGKKGRKNRRK